MRRGDLPPAVEALRARAEELPPAQILTALVQLATRQGAPPALMTTREVSDYLGVSVRTISRYMRQQPAPLPHQYVGRGVRFRREAIDAWIARQQGGAARLPEIVQNALASARKTV